MFVSGYSLSDSDLPTLGLNTSLFQSICSLKLFFQFNKNSNFSGGFSLSNTTGTQIIEDPEGDFTRQLYQWYRDQKPLQEIKSLTIKTDFATVIGKNIFQIRALSKILERDLRLIGPLLQHGIDRDSEKGQYLYIKGMVNAVKTEQAIYQVF